MKIVFDTKLRRPACAILQAVLGGDQGIANRFSSETWLISPTPDMSCYEVTEGQLTQLVEMADKAIGRKTRRKR